MRTFKKVVNSNYNYSEEEPTLTPSLPLKLQLSPGSENKNTSEVDAQGTSLRRGESVKIAVKGVLAKIPVFIRASNDTAQGKTQFIAALWGILESQGFFNFNREAGDLESFFNRQKLVPYSDTGAENYDEKKNCNLLPRLHRRAGKK